MKVVALAAFLAVAFGQAPVFHPAFEGRFTNVIQTRIEGRWVPYIEVGTEFFDRSKNNTREEVVRYENVNGVDLSFPEQRVHTAKYSYTVRENLQTGGIDCTYGPSSALPDPANLAWKYNDTRFFVPPARYSEETIWGARTTDVFTSSFKDQNGDTVNVLLGQDSFTKRTVAYYVYAPAFRFERIYRDFFEQSPNSINFDIPTYFKCHTRR